MKKYLFATVSVLLINVGPVAAQNPYYRPPVNRMVTYDPSPTVSPYLNLVPFVTADGQLQHVDGAYQNFVRPRLEQQQAFQAQQAQIAQLRSQLDSVQARQPAIVQSPQRTGHVARFQSFTHFYPRLNARDNR